MLTFYPFPPSQHKPWRTTDTTARLQEEFRPRVKAQASLPPEKAAWLAFFELFASGQVKMRRMEGWLALAEARVVAA